MNSDYCSSCGGKMEYLLSKPKFCPSCGISLAGAVASTKAAPTRLPRSVPRKVVPQNTIKDDPEGTDVDYVPQLDRLQYEVDADYSSVSRRVPLAQILGSNAPVESSSEVIQSSEPVESAQQAPSEIKKPTPQAQFDVVKKTIEECKSSAPNVVDVGEE